MSDPNGPRTSTWLIGAALVLSLAANAFFVGLSIGEKAAGDRPGMRFAGGGVGAPFGPPGPGGMPPDLDPRSFTRMLPESAREGARAILETQGPEIRERIRAALEARAATLEVMRAEPFDQGALEAALAASRAADAEATNAVHALTVSIVANLTPEERAQIGEDLGRRYPEFHDRHERWRDRRGH